MVESVGLRPVENRHVILNSEGCRFPATSIETLLILRPKALCAQKAVFLLHLYCGRMFIRASSTGPLLSHRDSTRDVLFLKNDSDSSVSSKVGGNSDKVLHHFPPEVFFPDSLQESWRNTQNVIKDLN